MTALVSRSTLSWLLTALSLTKAFFTLLVKELAHIIIAVIEENTVLFSLSAHAPSWEISWQRRDNWKSICSGLNKRSTSPESISIPSGIREGTPDIPYYKLIKQRGGISVGSCLWNWETASRRQSTGELSLLSPAGMDDENLAALE